MGTYSLEGSRMKSEIEAIVQFAPKDRIRWHTSYVLYLQSFLSELFYTCMGTVSLEGSRERRDRGNGFQLIFRILLKTRSTGVHPACCIFRVSILFNPHLNYSILPWGHFLWKGQERGETEVLFFSSIFELF